MQPESDEIVAITIFQAWSCDGMNISMERFDVGNDAHGLGFLQSNPKLILDMYYLYPESQNPGDTFEVSLNDLHESIFERLINDLKRPCK